MNKREKIYNAVICLLAIVSVALAIDDLWRGLPPAAKICDLVIYLIFVADYMVRIAMAKDKRQFIKSNIFDLIAIFPFNSLFRVFRILKIARLARLAKMSKAVKVVRFTSLSARGARGIEHLKEFVDTNGLKYMIFLTLASIGGASIGMMYFEKMSFLDALWWSFVTATTVGYGDLSPVTTAGRVIAALLMIVGIGLISSLTSAITSFFMSKHGEKEAVHNDRIDMVMLLYNELSSKEKEEFKNQIMH